MRLTTIPLAAALICAGCAATPAPTLHPNLYAPALVLGTVSYDAIEVSGHDWVVHFARVDAASQEYTLPVTLDADRRRGVFSGALPPGVYAFVDAGSPDERYPATGVPMPFEVEAGGVRDLGHYSLNPLTPR